MNDFSDLYKRCNSGTNEEKLRELRKFPDIIDIEVTNTCNFRCLMCPTGNRSLKRPARFMSQEVFYIIARQCAESGAALRFICWGEPLLHPSIVRWISCAKNLGVKTHINTNGSKLNRVMAEELINAGLDSIKISFQGVDYATYFEMRRSKEFHEIVNRVRDMRRLRGALTRPYIAVSTSVTHESKEDIDAFVRLFEGVADYVGVGKTTFDYLTPGAVPIKEDREQLLRAMAFYSEEKNHPRPCPEVFNKLSIHASGDAVVCCNDFDGKVKLGHVLDMPLKEIWMAPPIEEYRKRLARDDYSGPLCSVCYDYAGVTGS